MATPKQLRIDIKNAVKIELNGMVYYEAIVQGQLCTVIVIPKEEIQTHRVQG